MPIIKPRPDNQKTLVKLRAHLTQENHDTLHAFAAFIREDANYVLNQLIETVLAKDRDFLANQKTSTSADRTAPKLARPA